jgi:hypothetical protein
VKNRIWIVAFGICMLLATLSPLASASPDGLEKVAGDQGFLTAASSSPIAIVADYILPGVANEALATILAGWLGTISAFAVAYGAANVIVRFRKVRVAH